MQNHDCSSFFGWWTVHRWTPTASSLEHKMLKVVYCSNGDRRPRNFDRFGWFEPVVHYLIGVAAGVAGVVVGHPLDTVRVRQQTEAQSIYRCCASIVRNEGILGFFKGTADRAETHMISGNMDLRLVQDKGLSLTACGMTTPRMSSPLVSFTAVHAIAFGVYGNTIKLFEDQHSLLASFVAGNAAGFAQCIVTIPSELVKTKLQLQKDKKRGQYKSSYDCARKMIKTQGFLSLFKGTWVTLIRDGPSYGTWFLSYEFCTQKFSKDGTAQSLTTLQLLSAGGIAGVMSWICNYPVDVIKTKFQADDSMHSYSQVCRYIFRTQGMKGFFAGLLVTCARAIPANAAIFFAAEWSYRLIEMLMELY